jgi:hypothetical protein
MSQDFDHLPNEKWTKAGSLLVDFSSFENGFRTHLERERYRKEILDYIKYRESLVKWPSMNEEIKRG